MTLRELLLSVDAEAYADSQLFQKLLNAKPKVSKTQILDAILTEMSSGGFDEAEQTDFWIEMTNLQKAKIIR